MTKHYEVFLITGLTEIKCLLQLILTVMWCHSGHCRGKGLVVSRNAEGQVGSCRWRCSLERWTPAQDDGPSWLQTGPPHAESAVSSPLIPAFPSQLAAWDQAPLLSFEKETELSAGSYFLIKQTLASFWLFSSNSFCTFHFMSNLFHKYVLSPMLCITALLRWHDCK